MNAILITGPTASGKSALALELAARHNGVVLNADSMQVYQPLRVLTARPDISEMGGVEHRLYGHVAGDRLYSTGDWLHEINTEIDKVRQEGKLPVIIGGTGLYFRALTGGLSDMPAIADAIRQKWRSRLAEEGAPALHAQLASIDPSAANSLRPGDGQRIVRALEVMEASGRSIREFQTAKGRAIIDEADARKIIVLPDRAVLHERINRRFAAMLKGGAVDEVENLLAQKLAPEMPVMKAIGVAQIAQMLAGNLSKDEVIAKASAATRQYAKRQMTWFRNQMTEQWERLNP